MSDDDDVDDEEEEEDDDVDADDGTEGASYSGRE